MKRKILLAALVGLVSKPLLAAELIIDDFKTGHISRMSAKCGIEDKTVRADVPGKHRWVRLQVNTEPECKEGNAFVQSVSTSIQPGQPLIVNNGYKVHSRTELHYGRTNVDQKFPMNLDLTMGTETPLYLEVMFSGAAAGINLNVSIFANNGPKLATCGTNIDPNINGFAVAFPLADFKMVHEMRVADYQDADFLSFAIQTTDGNFGVSRIKVTSNPVSSALKVEC